MRMAAFSFGLGVVALFVLLCLMMSDAQGQEALHVDGVIDSGCFGGQEPAPGDCAKAIAHMCGGGCMNDESITIINAPPISLLGDPPDGPVFAALPDNPAPQKTICYRGAIDAAGRTTYAEIDCTSIPQWRELKAAPKKAGFFAMGRYDAPAPLRTARQVFDKKFAVLHGAGVLAMVLACRRARTSGEDWGSEVPAVLGVTGMDFLVSHYVSEALSVEAPVYMFQHYMRAAYR